jgi:SIR2-like domain
MSVSAARFGWLIGAGTSAAASIPTGYDMIVDFKTRLYASQTNIPRREIDPTDPLWEARIRTYFDGNHGLPSSGHPTEYAAAFEAVFPDVADRRRYIADCVKRGSPSFGHRLLAAAVVSRQVPIIFTTNFDQLVESSVAVADDLVLPADRVHLTVSAIDSADRARRCLDESDWPLLVKLHGDYQSTRLKNTSDELKLQDEQLRLVLMAACQRFGLIVVGYSGRDASVMETLHDALDGDTPFPAGVRWVLRSGHGPLPAVTQFVQAALSKGIDARFVESETFDELAGDLDRQLDLAPAVADHVLHQRPRENVVPVSVHRTEGARFPVLRCSALPVLQLPSHARRLRLNHAITTEESRAALRLAEVYAVVAARGSEVIAFGADEDLLKAFKPYAATLDGTVALDPLHDSWALGLLYDALVRALSRGRPLRPMLKRRGHSLVVREPSASRSAEGRDRDRQLLEPVRRAYSDALYGSVPALALPFAEAVRIRLEHHESQWWCVFDPFTWVDFPRLASASLIAGADEERNSGDATGVWRKERWARRYNGTWSALVDAWAGLLVSSSEQQLDAVGLRGLDGIEASFRLSATTGWSRPGHSIRGQQ